MCLFFCPLFTSQCNGLFLISRGAVKTGGAAITMTTTGGEDKVKHQHKVGRWSLRRVNSISCRQTSAFTDADGPARSNSDGGWRCQLRFKQGASLTLPTHQQRVWLLSIKALSPLALKETNTDLPWPSI